MAKAGTRDNVLRVYTLSRSDPFTFMLIIGKTAIVTMTADAMNNSPRKSSKWLFPLKVRNDLQDGALDPVLGLSLLPELEAFPG